MMSAGGHGKKTGTNTDARNIVFIECWLECNPEITNSCLQLPVWLFGHTVVVYDNPRVRVRVRKYDRKYDRK